MICGGGLFVQLIITKGDLLVNWLKSPFLEIGLIFRRFLMLWRISVLISLLFLKLKLDRARIPFSDSISGRALISLPWRSICFWSWARRNIALWRRELVEVMWRGLGRDDLITVRNEMSLMKLTGVSA